MKFPILILLSIAWTLNAQCPCPCTPTPAATFTPVATPTATVSGGLTAAVAEWALIHPGAPFAAMDGDSIMQGYPNFTSRAIRGGPFGNFQCDIATRLYQASGNIVTGTNDGAQGARMSNIDWKSHSVSLLPPPKYLIVEGGINDMHFGGTFADNQSLFAHIKSDCASHGSIMAVEEVWPSIMVASALISDWNSALVTWASSNGITLIQTHDWMADPADHTRMLPAYTVDGTHPSEMGVGRHADAIYNTLLQLEGQ